MTACAGALAVQRAIEKDNLLQKVRDNGASLTGKLEAAFGQKPYVGDIRGRGCFIGVELVRDRESKEPFDPALRLNARIKAKAMARGLMCYPNGGTVDGTRGDHVLLAPPLILEEPQLDELVEKLEGAIGDALSEAGVAS